MSEFETPADFTARYGFAPQEYFNRVVKSDAAAPKLAAEEKALAEAKAALVPGGWENLTDQRAMQDGADAENLYLAQVQVVSALKAHQKAALAFLAGEIKDYQPFLGAEGQELYRLGWIDTTVVPE